MVALNLVLNTRRSGGFSVLSENMMTLNFKYLGCSVKHTLDKDTSIRPSLKLEASHSRSCIVNFRDFTIFADNYAWHYADQTEKSACFWANMV